MKFALVQAAASAFVVVALSLTGGENGQSPSTDASAARATQAGPQLGDAVGRTLFFAVLEGLYEDGADDEVVDRVLALDPQTSGPRHFVPGCPICVPTLDAFRVYRSRAPFHGRKFETNTFGPGLASDLRQHLLDADEKVFGAALQELVQRWTERRLALLRLTDEERARWSIDLAERRKLGMSVLLEARSNPAAGAYAAMKSCPSCDGAAGACPLR